MALLCWVGSNGKARTLKLGELTLLGRGKECEMVLEDRQASREHAEIRKVGGAFVLKDLESKNGTFVNGTPVSSWTLKDGDVIRIGRAEFRFRS